MEHDLQRTRIDQQTGNLIRFRVHMGDGAGIYGRWHAFIRAAVVFDDIAEWLSIDRAVAVA